MRAHSLPVHRRGMRPSPVRLSTNTRKIKLLPKKLFSKVVNPNIGNRDNKMEIDTVQSQTEEKDETVEQASHSSQKTSLLASVKDSLIETWILNSKNKINGIRKFASTNSLLTPELQENLRETDGMVVSANLPENIHNVSLRRKILREICKTQSFVETAFESKTGKKASIQHNSSDHHVRPRAGNAGRKQRNAAKSRNDRNGDKTFRCDLNLIGCGVPDKSVVEDVFSSLAANYIIRPLSNKIGITTNSSDRSKFLDFDISVFGPKAKIVPRRWFLNVKLPDQIDVSNCTIRRGPFSNATNFQITPQIERRISVFNGKPRHLTNIYPETFQDFRKCQDDGILIDGVLYACKTPPRRPNSTIRCKRCDKVGRCPIVDGKPTCEAECLVCGRDHVTSEHPKFGFDAFCSKCSGPHAALHCRFRKLEIQRCVVAARTNHDQLIRENNDLRQENDTLKNKVKQLQFNQSEMTRKISDLEASVDQERKFRIGLESKVAELSAMIQNLVSQPSNSVSSKLPSVANKSPSNPDSIMQGDLLDDSPIVLDQLIADHRYTPSGKLEFCCNEIWNYFDQFTREKIDQYCTTNGYNLIVSISESRKDGYVTACFHDLANHEMSTSDLDEYCSNHGVLFHKQINGTQLINSVVHYEVELWGNLKSELIPESEIDRELYDIYEMNLTPEKRIIKGSRNTRSRSPIPRTLRQISRSRSHSRSRSRSTSRERYEIKTILKSRADDLRTVTNSLAALASRKNLHEIKQDILSCVTDLNDFAAKVIKKRKLSTLKSQENVFNGLETRVKDFYEKLGSPREIALPTFKSL